MAGGIQWRLAWYLNVMGKEELQKFQLRLPKKPQKAGAVEVASQLVAQYGEQQAWDLALRTWEQMGLSGLCAQAQAEANLMSAECFAHSPGAPGVQSPSSPTSTEVLRFVQDPEPRSSRQPPRTSGLTLPNRDLSSPFYLRSPIPESPSAPTSTAVLGGWEPPLQPSPEPGKQEAPRAGWPLAETSGQHSTGIRERLQHQKRKRPCPTEAWGNEDLPQGFIELLLLHQSHPKGRDWHQRSKGLSKGSWHPGTAKKQGYLIELKDLFEPGLHAQEEPRRVVLHGVAGVGKSTVARQVRRAWEEGRLYRDLFEHVFYLSCRELAQCKKMSLKELITKDWAAPTAPTEQILSQSAQLLFILDDLDELKWVLWEQSREARLSWDQQQPVEMLLGGLLRRTFLPKASLLITARTAPVEKFILPVEPLRRVMVLGFSESGRKEYFYKYFKSESEADRAFRLVESNQALWTMCLVPLASWLVCSCVQKQLERGEALGLAPQTATALCLHYLSRALPAQLLGPQLRGLCSLAARGIRQGESLLPDEDLRKHNLKEASISALLKTGILEKHPSSPSYRFAHRNLQEFFAAVSFVLEVGHENGDPLACIREPESPVMAYGRLEPFAAPTACFVLGLLSEQAEREMEAVFQCKVPGERRRELLQWVQMEVWMQSAVLCQRSLPMLHCFYETQDQDFLTPTMARFQGASMHVHTGLELLVFMFCIKFCNVKKLQLSEDRQHRHAWRSPSTALLRGVPVTDACWKVLFFTLRVTGNLKELDLSGNRLNHKLIESLCETLRFSCCHLEVLRLASCNLTDEDCLDLALVLGTSQTLTELDLNFNRLQDTGVQHLCNGLSQLGCRLQRLRLAGCGLTSRCCMALACVLGTSPSLTELDLQQNELGDPGVWLLCDGLWRPGCRLQLLCLDKTQLSEEVTQMLRALEKEKSWLVICSKWKPSGTMPREGPSKGETSGTFSLKQERQESEGIAPQVAPGELASVPSPAPPEDLPMEPLETDGDFWGPLGPVATEVVDKDRSLYRVHLPVAGSYRWPYTGLRFVVRGPVTIDIEFCTWDQLLHQMAPKQGWMVAGPLFDIKAQSGAVTTVYLPHFMDLRGGHVDASLFQVAHFKEEGMLLEKPTRVELYHVVLEEPSFSPIGVLLRTFHTALRFFPVISTVLLYHHLQPEEIVFHLYLIPSDCSIRKAVDNVEKAHRFVQIRKPPPLTSLYLGSRYAVCSSEKLEPIPRELELCYRSPEEPQLYSEFYIGHLRSGLRLYLRNENGTVVWEALVKPGDLQLAASLVSPAPTASPPPPGVPAFLHFVDQHREQLVARVTSVEPVLDRLLGQVLSEEQYERVRARATATSQMRELFSFSRSWDRACKDQVYQALKETHLYLITELWEAWGRGGEQGASPTAQ